MSGVSTTRDLYWCQGFVSHPVGNLHTPRKDGISEVGNQIILGRANAMMQHAYAPRSYLAEAVVTAV